MGDVYDIGRVYIIDSDADLDVLLGTEEALTEEDVDWLRWLALDFDDDGYGDECIEADYDFIRRGC